MRPVLLEKALRMIPNFDCRVCKFEDGAFARICTTFARQDQIRQVLTEFGVCPVRRKRPPHGVRRPGSCTLRMMVKLPEDWLLSSKP